MMSPNIGTYLTGYPLMPEFDLTCMSILKARGVELHCIIDVGASDGRWTREVQQLFPKASYLLIEPRQECLPALHALHGHVHIETALVGACEGEVELNVHDLQTSIYRNTKGERYGAPSVQRMTTLDALIHKWFQEEAAMLPPSYVKVDVQGHELEVIKGARETIERYRPMIQLELNLMRFYSGIPIAHEVIAYMGSIGYVIYDFTDPLRRTLDQALGNIDCVFVHEDSELRQDSRWGWGSWS
jgi:FkbM family methyltransferase